MRCTFSRCLSLAVLLAACAPALHAQQAIQVFLSAVDADGKPVSDLRAEDVAVQTDGAACRTTKFEEINWPVRLTLMIDNGPVHSDALRQLRDALRKFVAELPTDMDIT